MRERRGEMPALPDIERRKKANGIILTVALVSAFACFIPILELIPTESSLAATDDYAHLNATCQFFQAATSCLVISIVPMGDLLVEWINSCTCFDGLFSVFGLEQRKRRAKAAAFLDIASVRMNLSERTMFVAGVICWGGNQSFPALYLSPLHAALGVGVSSVAGVFTRMPIISLLCRISPTWTPLRSVFLVVMLGVVHVLWVSTRLFPALKALNMITNFLFLGLSFVALWIIILAIYNMFVRRSTMRTDTIIGDGMANDHSEQRFHNVVITIHMFAAYFPGILQMVWNFFGSHWTADLHSSMIYAQLACSVVVFVLDGHVCKIESASTVFEFLDYKKSYVKHISHDLHTPLNAATLGLNMAIIQMKKHNRDHLVDDKLIETLSDIRWVCNAATNSLNDFLFSGHVESGILELCLETTPVVNFVCEAINIDLISEQAIAKKVALDVLFHVDAAVLAMYPTALPLRLFDCFSCDRSKMDQVLQKLVSNAIEFSQEDSTITIRAFFCASIDDSPITSSVVADDDIRRLRPLQPPPTTDLSEKSERSKSSMNSSYMGIPSSIPRNRQIFASSKEEGGEEEDSCPINDDENNTAFNVHGNSSEDALLGDALIVESRDILLNGVSSKSNHPAIAAAVGGDSSTDRRSVDDVPNPINSSPSAGLGPHPSPRPSSNPSPRPSSNASPRPSYNASPGSSPSPGLGDVDGYLIVTVSDIGADGNDQPLLDDMSGRSGSGFGLFISKCLVDLHGGNSPLDPLTSSILPHLSLSFSERLSGSLGVSSAGEGQGSSFTLSMPMKRKGGSDRDNHRRAMLGGSLFQSSLHSPQQQQPINGRSNHNEYELADMRDVFRSRSEEGDRNDDHARFGTVNGFNINTVLSREREPGIGTHVNRPRSPYRHYPQRDRHSPRRSFTFVKDVLPADDDDDADADADADAHDDDADDDDALDDDANDGIIIEESWGGGPDVPSLLDDGDYAVEQTLQTTLPTTSHHIQIMQQLQLQPSASSALAPGAPSVGTNERYSAYQLLVLDDSNLLCTALRTDGHHCDEAKDVTTAMAMINERLLHRHIPSANKSVSSVNPHMVAGGGGKATSDDGDGDGLDMYDAVIIAVRNGPSICRSIRALSASVAIFGVTDTVFFQEESRRYRSYGATSVLVKPFDIAFFMDFLRQMKQLEMENQSKKQGMLMQQSMV